MGIGSKSSASAKTTLGRKADGMQGESLASGPPAVVWTNKVNVTDQGGGTLRKTAGGNAWNAGAIGTVTLDGPGYIECTIEATDKHMVFGLSQDVPDFSNSNEYAVIDFGLYIAAYEPPVAKVLQNGNEGGDGVPTAVGSRFRVAVDAAGTIRYSHNGTVYLTNEASAQFPLTVCATIHGTDGAIVNAVISQ